MSDQEATFVFRFETRPAEEDLDRLNQKGAEAAEKASREVESKSRLKGYASSAAGGAVASTRSGALDIAGAGLTGIGDILNSWVLGHIDDQARADMRARADVVEIYKHGGNVEGARTLFEDLRKRYGREERNAGDIRKAVGKDIVENLISGLVKGIGSYIEAGVDKIVEKLNPLNFGGK